MAVDLVHECRFACRALLKSSHYSGAVLVVLALAVCANTSVFSAVYGILLKPSPVEQPQNLVVVWDTAPSRSLPVVELSYRTVENWSRHSRSFASVAAVGSSTWPAILTGRGHPVRVASAGVSATLFNTLGVAPMLGRGLLPADDVPNAPAVAVLSHATWVQYFGADPGVVGSTLDADSRRTIVGVMPREFDFPRGTSYWFPVVPLLSSASRDFDGLAAVGVLFAVGRLRPGVTPAAAAEELDRLAAAPGVPAAQRFGSAVAVTAFLDYVLGPVRRGLWVLWAAAGLLLLVACANVSGLMLTRASAMSREHAIRAALGATRVDIGRLWLMQATLLAVAGGAIGIGAASWMTKIVLRMAPEDVPRLTDVTINPIVGVFSAGVVLVCAGLCGVVPARRASSDSVAERLNDEAYGTPGRMRLRGRYALLSVQVAFSVALLICGGLIVRSFTALGRLDLGFVPADVITMFVGPLSNQDMRTLITRVEGLRQVEAAGAIYLRPLELGPIGQETSARLEGQTESTARRNPTLNFQAATPGYFRSLRIRLVQGRFFSEDDRAGRTAVALVGETAARRLWPGEDPIGRKILLAGQQEWRTVVGVVGDVHYRGIGDARLDVYEPASQSASTPNYIAIRTPRNPADIVAAVRSELGEIAPTAVVDSVKTLDAIVERAVAPWRFTSWLLSGLASAAFLLTTVGLVSVVSLETRNRRQELAIRLALGARRRDLLRSVLLPATSWSVVGLLAGAALALAVSRAMRGLLYQVEPLDPMTWLTVVTMVIAVVGLATYLPARRAAAIEPTVVLRT